MKIYDLVHELLIKDVSLRNSDLKLIWAVLEKTDKVRNNFISYTNFMSSIPHESITRARRKIQQLHPELKAVKEVEEKRKEREAKFPKLIFEEINNV